MTWWPKWQKVSSWGPSPRREHRALVSPVPRMICGCVLTPLPIPDDPRGVSPAGTALICHHQPPGSLSGHLFPSCWFRTPAWWTNSFTASPSARACSSEGREGPPSKVRIPTGPSEPPSRPPSGPAHPLGHRPGLSWALEHPASLVTQPVEGVQENLYVYISFWS